MNSAIVTPELLTVLGVAPMRGRLFNDADSVVGAEDVAILSYQTWTNDFGREEGVMPDASEVTLFTTEPCGFCRQAKALLESPRDRPSREVNLAKDPDGRADLVALTGQLTFPQIVIGKRSRSAASGSCSRPTEPASSATSSPSRPTYSRPRRGRGWQRSHT